MQPTQHTSDDVLNEILKRLISEFQPEAIYFFGSRARGDSGADSDYDLMLVIPNSAVMAGEPRYRRMQRVQKILWGIWTAVDVIILTREEFDRERQVICSLPSTVLREGKQLYAA